MISLKPIKLKPAQLSIEQINTYINQSNTMNELITPKEKALELIDNFTTSCIDGDFYSNAKQSAFIAVNLILNETGCGNCKEIDSHYWNKVLHELELMKETN